MPPRIHANSRLFSIASSVNRIQKLCFRDLEQVLPPSGLGTSVLLECWPEFARSLVTPAISHSQLVDATASSWYHCISCCVRRARLLGDKAAPGRKDWIENRLKELDQIFAVSVGGFSLTDNHLHLLLCIEPEVADGWSDSEVVERWFRLFPPRGSDRKPMKVSKELVAARVGKAVEWQEPFVVTIQH